MGPAHPHRSTAPPLGSIGFVVLFLLWAIAPSLLAQEAGGEPVETYEKSLAYQMAIPELDGYFPETEKLMAVPISRLLSNLAHEETDAPIPSDLLEDFISTLNRVSARSDQRRCNISPAEWGGAPANPKEQNDGHVLDAILAQETLILGAIEHSTPIWDFHYDTVATLVFVRIEEILQAESGVFSVGQLVTFIRWWGETTVLGVPLCTGPPSGIHAGSSPGVGDQIILTGAKDLRNPDHLVTHPSRIFPVVDGVVSPPAGARGYSDHTVALDEVRERLR